LGGFKIWEPLSKPARKIVRGVPGRTIGGNFYKILGNIRPLKRPGNKVWGEFSTPTGIEGLHGVPKRCAKNLGGPTNRGVYNGPWGKKSALHNWDLWEIPTFFEKKGTHRVGRYPPPFLWIKTLHMGGGGGTRSTPFHTTSVEKRRRWYQGRGQPLFCINETKRVSLPPAANALLI